MVVLLMLACSGSGNDGDKFFSSDGRYTPPEWGSSSTDDTAATDTADTGGSEGDPGAPVFSSFVVTWEDFPNIGTVLQGLAEFTDENDDAVGGICYVDLFNPDFISDYQLTVSEESGNDVCLVSGNTITIAFKDLDATVAGSLTLSVKDSSGNVSAEVTDTTD